MSFENELLKKYLKMRRKPSVVKSIFSKQMSEALQLK